jgi:hypothetical protein
VVIFPVIAAGISAIFSILLFRQFSRRHRLSQLAWGIALAMYAVASMAVAAGVSGGWDPTLFRLYWLFGALLNVPWLALGSVALLNLRPVTVATLLAVVAGTVWGIARVAAATIREAALLGSQIPTGKSVFCDTSAGVIRNCDPARALAITYSTPAWIVVILIALASAARRGGRRPTPERVRASWLVAIGVTIVAVGSTALVRIGRGSAFSVTLALGVLVMFGGFMLASRAGSPPPPEATPPDFPA